MDHPGLSFGLNKGLTMSVRIGLQYCNTRWYEFWSSKLCEGDLITCRICIPNEFWSTCEALHIIGLFSDHVFKMKFGPLSNCSKNELWSTFDFRCNHWYESGAKFIFRAIWKWTKLHFKHVIREQPYASQVDQNSFGMHILHVIRSPSHTLLDQNSYPRVPGSDYICK